MTSVPVAVAVSVAVVLLAVTIVPVTVRRRRRGPRIPDETAAERALRARNEQIAAQERATRMHPDVVRHWMRPR
jgi:hypothetical protein